MKPTGRSDKSKSARPKHVPQRTCIACRQVAGKRKLIRLVRTVDGVLVDTSGKMAGRGAYIHPDPTCWATVLDSRRLEQALRTRISKENRQLLLDFMATLAQSESSEAELAEN